MYMTSDIVLVLLKNTRWIHPFW